MGKIIKIIQSFLLLSNNITFNINIPSPIFINEIKRELKRKRNIYGKISNDNFNFFFLSNTSIKRQSPFPFIDISGNIKTIKNKTIIQLKLKLSSIPRYIIIASTITPLVVMLFLYLNNNFNLYPLLITPFTYFLIFVNFKIELYGFNTYFKSFLSNLTKKQQN